MDDPNCTYFLCPDASCELFTKTNCHVPCDRNCPQSAEKAIVCFNCGEINKLPYDHISWCSVKCKCGAYNFQRMSGKYRRHNINSMVLNAYKLVRLRKDGSIGPLFINRTQRIPYGVWLPAENHPTKGYAQRPGWHTALKPIAPHLSTKDRMWVHAKIKDYRKLKRPKSQGDIWMISNWIKIIKPAVKYV